MRRRKVICRKFLLLHPDDIFGRDRWFCLDLLTGKQAWNAQGKGSLTYADGILYCLEERGTMALVEATPREHRLISSFRLPRGGAGLYRAHPVVCGGGLQPPGDLPHQVLPVLRPRHLAGEFGVPLGQQFVELDLERMPRSLRNIRRRDPRLLLRLRLAFAHRHRTVLPNFSTASLYHDSQADFFHGLLDKEQNLS